MAAGAKQDLQDFLRANANGWQLVWKAREDYLFCRLGMTHAMWSSFEMATQAIEKLLKGYSLMRDPSFSGDIKPLLKAIRTAAKARGRTSEFGHDVEACLDVAQVAGLPVSSDLAGRVATINSYYARRYPDNASAPNTLSTGQIGDVDKTVFEIWDAFKAINEDYYYTTGMFTDAYAVAVQPSGSTTTNFQILTARNAAYATRQADVREEIRTRIKTWYDQEGVPPLVA
tara:strand:- start:377 stop:1063 length:687 start_codon:yes stop_codon:yes gene_type:complete